MKKILTKWNSTSLILRILTGMIIGIILGLVIPQASGISILGSMFVGALKGIAPILVFVLVMSSIANAQTGNLGKFSQIIILYMTSNFCASLLSVLLSYVFPVTVKLDIAAYEADSVPMGISEVLENLAVGIFTNPVQALSEANYLSILFWAIVFGIAIRFVAKDSVKNALGSFSDAVSKVVRWIISLAPFGILGLVFGTVSENGLSIFADYGKLLAVLVATMFIHALVTDPIISSITLRRNSYPLALRCLRESGVTAFFTRSSAANIPINMSLCKRLGLNPDLYSVSIPLGATINMDGAAITITTMTMTIAHTLGIQVDIPTAVILCVLATLGAAGASGVAGGSLLLIPMACSLFGISQDISMQAVGIGMIIGVVQDSLETCINSSGDVLFTATTEYKSWIKEGREFKVGAIINPDEDDA